MVQTCREVGICPQGHHSSFKSYACSLRTQVLADSHRVHFAQPLGEIVESAVTLEKNFLNDEELLEKVLVRLLVSIRDTILEQIKSNDLRAVSSLCISQPHRCKKDIQFTSLLVSMVLAKDRGWDFIWGSDSDSIVRGRAIHNTIDLLGRSPRNGGA
jgi:hypothetical protein